MSEASVIAFPPRGAAASKPDAYRDWLAWAECELAILGYDLSACDYDWQRAHAKGLRPEAAAAQAAEGKEAS